VTDVLAEVRTELVGYFDRIGVPGEPSVASVTFLGAESIDVLRFGPDSDDVRHYVSLGCARHPMLDPTAMMVDSVRGPRAEVVVSLRGATPTGLVRSIAVVAASPAVEGLVLVPDALVDLETPLWQGAPFTAMLLGPSDIDDVVLPEPSDPVTVLTATPITPTEAAWVRLKGAEAMREAWRTDGVDVRDPRRPASSPS
jgi:Suppressor of fused protein (SUFU)